MATLTTREATEQILAILAQVPTQQLPAFKETEDGCLWFRDLSMGWTSSSHPERMARSQVAVLIACESASRELIRRRDSQAATA